MFLVTKMNYEAERAMNQKRLRMEEPGHGVVQGNGLPLNYIGESIANKLHFIYTLGITRKAKKTVLNACVVWL